jgi:hypothetical protein
MDRRVRVVEQTASEIFHKEGIREFSFANGSKHKKIIFVHAGRKHTIPFSTSPRTSNQSRLISKQITRILRG